MWSGSIQYDTFSTFWENKNRKSWFQIRRKSVVLLTKSLKCLMSVALTCVKRRDWHKDRQITNDPQPTHQRYCCTYIFPTNLHHHHKYSSISPTFNWKILTHCHSESESVWWHVCRYMIRSWLQLISPHEWVLLCWLFLSPPFLKKWRTRMIQWDSQLQKFGPLKCNQLKQPTSHTWLLGLHLSKLKERTVLLHGIGLYWFGHNNFWFCYHYYKLGLILASTWHCSEVVSFFQVGK